MSLKYSFPLFLAAIFCYKTKQNRCFLNQKAFDLFLLHMRIIETCIKTKLFPLKNEKMRVINIFNFKVCAPLTQLLIIYTVDSYGPFTQYMQVGSCVKEGNGMRQPEEDGYFKQIQCSHVCEQILSKFASLYTYYHYIVTKHSPDVDLYA